MNNKEKAYQLYNELSHKCGSLHYGHTVNALIAMADWKDQQNDEIIKDVKIQDKYKTDLTHLADLDCNGNWVRFLRGNDGDLHIVMATADDMTPDRYKGIMHSVRVGVGNSGGQEVPHYVKKALSELVSAFEKWEKDENN